MNIILLCFNFRFSLVTLVFGILSTKHLYRSSIYCNYNICSTVNGITESYKANNTQCSDHVKQFTDWKTL